VDGGLDFDEFYASTFRRTVGQVYAMTGNAAESEDSVQEAFARAWQRWDHVRGYAEPEAWVRTVAYRIPVSSWRKAANRLTAYRRHGAAQDVPELSPDHLVVVEALRQVSPAQRQVIVLHHLAGRSVEEISAETGMPTGTVKSHLQRGRKALAPHVDEAAEPGPADPAADRRAAGAGPAESVLPGKSRPAAFRPGPPANHCAKGA
jgi:RNA polymerase sigma-70 factor (ECF subfamily)